MNRMMQAGSMWRLATALLAVVSFGIAGCNTASKQTVSYDAKGSSYWGEGGPNKPAPTPAPTPAPSEGPKKPAPAPAPAPAAGQVCSNLYYPTGDKASSAVWLQKCLPSEVSVGETFTSEIKVTNLTQIALTDVVITDQLPEGYELASTDPVTESAAGGKLTWRFAKLEPLSTKVVKVVGKATKVGALANCATVSYNTVLCVETKVVQPALVLAKTLTPEALACDPIMMTLKVTNSGSGAARDVKIADKLPEGLMTKDGAKEVNIDVGTLAAGQSKDYSVELKAAGAGKFENTASAMAAGGLKAEAKASTSITKPVLTIVQDCPKKAFIGSEVCHDITVTNKGDGVAKGAKLLVTLPAGVTATKLSEGTAAGANVTWNLGDLAPGATKKVTICVKPAKDGTYKLASAASAYCAETVAATCETVIEGIPAILLEVIDFTDPVAVGGQTTYKVTATNQGSAVGKDVAITVTLEDNAEFVSTLSDKGDKSDTAGTAAGKVITFAPLADLAVGGKATWFVTVKALKAGDVRFAVKMTEKQLTRSVDETEATNFYDSK